MRTFLDSRSRLALLLITIMILGGSVIPAAMLSRNNATAARIPQPPTGNLNQLGIDCGLGTTQAVLNSSGFPVAPSENGAPEILPACTWIGDAGRTATATPDATTEPLVSDQDETLSTLCTPTPPNTCSEIGGGFTADMVYLQNSSIVSTINGFDISINWNPAVLHMVKFDQSGLPWSTLGIFTPTSPVIDNVLGHAEFPQIITSSPIGGDVVLFRMKFDVVGVGTSPLIISSDTITNPGAVQHQSINGAFDSETFFDPTHTLNWSASWTNTTDITPGTAVGVKATATCTGCTGALSYSWDFDSDGTADATGNPASIVIPTATQPGHRVVLTISDSATPTPHSVTVVQRLPRSILVQGPQGPTTIAVNTGQAWTGMWLGGIPTYNAAWRFCPGSALAKTVCAVPSVTAAGLTAQVNTQTLNSLTAPLGAYHFAGVYTDTLKVTDTASPPISAFGVTITSAFLVNVTGTPQAFGVTMTDSNPTVVSGVPVTFSAAVAYDATYPATFKSTTFSYKFIFGDGTSQTVTGGLTQSTTHIYISGGSFFTYVIAQETGAAAISAIQETSNRIFQTVVPALTGDFTFAPANPVATQSVTFIATITGGTTPYTYSWAFGDGTTGGNMATIAHTYAAPGSFTATLTVTDTTTNPGMQTFTKSHPVIVGAGPLTVSISGPTTGTVSTPVTFTATPSGGNGPYTFAWTATGGTPASGTSASFTTTYSTTGSKAVSVLVTDSTTPTKQTATASATVTISAAALTVTINCPTTGTVGTAVACTAISSGGTGTVTFSWTATGGTPASGTGASFSTTYSAKGSDTISVTATDSASPPVTATNSATVTISPLALAVSIAGPTNAPVGTAVAFTATGSGGTGPYTFAWTATGGSPATGTGAGLTTTYSAAGTYTVSVIITDANAKTATASATIVITAAALTVSISCPTTGTVGTAVSCSASSSGGTGAVSFAWTAIGGSPASGTGSTFMTTYNVKGSHTISVTATDSASPPVTATNSATTTISPLALAVSISGPTTGSVGTAVTFTATGSGGTAPYSLVWTATGGSPSSATGSKIITTYNVKGSYTVSVTITDSNANTATASATIGISPLALSVIVNGPTTGTVGTPATFTATGSGGTTPYTFSWTATGGSPSTGTGSSITTTYATKGTYTVSVTITDGNGGTATGSATIVVGPLALAVSISGPTTGGVNTAVTFTATGTGGTSPYTFSWTATGGSPATGTGSSLTTMYANPGTFTVSVTITDGNAKTATASATIIVSPGALSVTINCPLTGTVGSPVNCTASSNGGTGTVSFSWTATGGTPASGTGASFSTTYSTKGTDTISVTATDSATPPVTATNSATVTISPLTLAVTISGPTTGTAGTAVTFTATGSGGTGPYTFSWTATGGSPASGTGASLTSTYNVKGTFTVSVTITDSNTKTASASVSIIISPVTLAVSIAGPTTGTVGTAVTFAATGTGGTTPYTFAWTATGGTPSSGTSAAFSTSFNAAGTFTVSVTITDSNGKTATSSTTVSITATSLTVTINCPTTGTVGTPVVCTASATGGTGAISFAWTATGGTPSSGTGTSFSTIYGVKGSFTISVTGTDSASPPITGTSSATVAISPLALAVSISGPTTGLVNSPALFTASASGGTGPFTFSWTATGGTPATGSGSSFTAAYSAKGSYTVSVTVTDANAKTASSTATIVISPLALTVSISGLTTGTAGITVTFTATGLGGTTPYSFAWTATGGSPATGTTSTLTTTYATSGTYTVSVTLTDGNGQTSTNTATIVISPAAALVVTISCPTTGIIGTMVNCTASSNGGTGTVTFSWTAIGGSPSSGTGASFSTTYNVKGTYTISVTGTDSASATDTKSATILISPLALSADFTFTPSAPTNATAVTFTATVTGGTAPYSYNWSFGDSTSSTSNPATHTFAPGTFTVTLNVTDSNGISKIVTHTVTVTSSVSGQPILLTFQAFNFTAFHDGFGSFQVLVNGRLVTSVGIPFVRSATIANATFAPGADKFVTFGPFDITAFVVQGPNNITFVNPTSSRFSLIKNIMIVQGNTFLLNFKGARFISPGRPVTLTFSNPPLSITGFSASNNSPFIDQDVTFTATFTGGTGPFKCLFRFGDDDFWGVSANNGSCSVTTDFDDSGAASVSVRITGSTTGDDQRASLTLNIIPDNSSSTTQQSAAAQCQTSTTEPFTTSDDFEQETN